MNHIAFQFCQCETPTSNDLNTTELEDLFIPGCSFGNDNSSPRELIENLQRVYLFSACETGDGKLTFFKQAREGHVAATIQPDDLGASEGELGTLYEQEISQFSELPTKIEVKYKNYNKYHDDASETIGLPKTSHVLESKLSTDLTLIPIQARTSAGRLLARAWTERRSFKFSLLAKNYHKLKPGYVVYLPLERPEGTGVDYALVQITSRDLGTNYLVNYEAVNYLDDSASRPIFEIANYYQAPYLPPIPLPIPAETNSQDPVAAGGGGSSSGSSGGGSSGGNGSYYGGAAPSTPSIPRPATANIISLDIPAVSTLDSTQEDGIYFALQQTGNSTWSAGRLFYSVDGQTSTQYNANLQYPSTVGTVVEALPPARYEILDLANSIVVSGFSPGSAALISIDENKFMNRAENLALIGNEIICYKTATLSENGYTLSTLQRGCYGTEWAINSHTANEKFVLLKGSGASLYRLYGLDLDTIVGHTLQLKAVGLDASPSAVPYSASVLVKGESVRPYSPVNLEKFILPNGDIKLRAFRRDRKQASSVEAWTTLPAQSENAIAISFSIRNNENIKRIFSLVTTDPAEVTYTLGQQGEDGYVSTNNSWDCRVFQIGTNATSYPIDLVL